MKVSIPLVILSCISELTSSHLLAYDIGFSFYYISYFILGDIIYNKVKLNKKNNGILFIIIGFLFLLVLCPIHYFFSKKGMDSSMINVIQGNFNPLIILASIFIFLGFAKLNIKKDFYKLSSLTLYIYIFHVIPCDIIFKVIRYLGYLNYVNPNIVIVFGTIFVLILSILFSKIWLMIWNIINKNDRIYNFIDRLAGD